MNKIKRFENGVIIDEMSYKNTSDLFPNLNTSKCLKLNFNVMELKQHYENWLNEISSLDQLMDRVESIKSETYWSNMYFHGGTRFINWHKVMFIEPNEVSYHQANDYTHTGPGKMYFMPRRIKVHLQEENWHISICGDSYEEVIVSFKTEYSKQLGDFSKLFKQYFPSLKDRSLGTSWIEFHLDNLALSEVITLPDLGRDYSRYLLTLPCGKVITSSGVVGLVSEATKSLSHQHRLT